MKNVFVGVCIFRREQFSKIERGIAIGNGDSDIWTIVDKDFKALDSEPYMHTVMTAEGCMVVEL